MQIRVKGGKTVEVEDGIELINLDEEEVFFEGERLTEARAEQIAREIARRHGLKGGRPKLSPEGSSRLGIRIPSDLREKLRAKAETENVSESELAREAIAAFLGAAV
jgi:hypothetical protein